jgi:hypothetical protein
MNESSFDLGHLVADWDGRSCPVWGCTDRLGTAESQWGTMPYCPTHALRIHPGSGTFVYDNGPGPAARVAAARRNIRFHPDYFATHIVGNAHKADSGRMAHETSEDALTWNVFARLASGRHLARATGFLTGRDEPAEPDLYLWGLRIAVNRPETPAVFPPLLQARSVFEAGIRRFLTEPDIILFVPGRFLAVIEAKFTSGNPLAAGDPNNDPAGEKPQSILGLLRRYRPEALTSVNLGVARAGPPFYGQLYRNLVFAIFMAERLGVDWYLINLVSRRQSEGRPGPEHADPTAFVTGLLPPEYRGRFRRTTWEDLTATTVRGVPDLEPLVEYLASKTAFGRTALDV